VLTRVVGSFLLLSVLVSPAVTSAELKSTLIKGVPHVEQKPDFCGEACVEMATARLGSRVSQDDVFAVAGVDPALGRGVLAKELRRAVKRLGFNPGKVWHRVKRRRPGPDVAAQFSKLHADLVAGVPSIVCMYYDGDPGATQHFRLILGYDSKKDEVIYHEPAEARGGYRRMSRRRLLKTWPIRYRRRHDILVRLPLRLKNGKLKLPKLARASYSPADYVQHVMKVRETAGKLRGRLQSGGAGGGSRFKVRIEPPFVVVGDGRLRDIRYTSKRLIRWSVDELKRLYFKKDPKHIITIWLFAGRRSFLANTKRLTGESPGTPFGFYSPSLRALIMNIRTGGGTLVHEIVHPFMEANFPACPPWFNEGMGSLYEGVGRRNHRIWGYINWRLPGLQRALRSRGGVPPFAELMAQNEDQFYEKDPGTNYAQSRYLVYYLQDKGLLRDYYRRFVKNHAKDPTGLETLKQVVGAKDITAFQRRWERYVLGLRYVRPAVK
jgi:hypothetical protein